MDEIYKGLGIIDSEGSQRDIDIISRGASEFPLVMKCIKGKWGIWMVVADKYLLVNPIKLVNSLFADGRHYDFFVSFEEDDTNRYAYFTERKVYSIEATLGHPLMETSMRSRFMFKEYVEKVQSACSALAEMVKKEEPLAYIENEISKEAVLSCAAQLALGATLPSYYEVRTTDVVIESFVFNPLEDEYAELYEIKLGNRGYKTWLTHWDSNMEAIRHEFESIVYEEETTIKLTFDTSDTLIKMKKERVLDKMTDLGHGYAYDYKDCMLVEIHPNEFVHMPIFKGYCDTLGMIRSLYEGLLRMAMKHPEKRDEDTPSLMVAYNKYKSPLIESYLKNDYVDIDRFAIRQVVIKHILTIDPDYDQLFVDEEGVSHLDEDFDGLEGSVINLEALIAWQKEIEPIVVASETGEYYEKDWEDYHRRGIALAKQLREQLPPSYDLWYTAPFEDKSNIIKSPMLIF